MDFAARREGWFALVGLSFAIAGSQAFAGLFDLDFDTDPRNTIFTTGTSQWRSIGGVNDSGYLAITDAVNDEIGAILIGDLDNGGLVDGFVISADLRVGGGTSTNPGDGFSFNFAAFDDPAVLDIVNGGTGFWAGVSIETILPENTGLALVGDGIPGDITGDGKVDAADLNILGINWRKDPATAAEGDLNGDGKVDAGDLNVLALNWQVGVAPAAAAAVPEPAGLLLLAIGGLALLFLRC